MLHTQLATLADAGRVHSSHVTRSLLLAHFPGTMRLRILPGTKMTFFNSLPCVSVSDTGVTRVACVTRLNTASGE